jgi:hydroxylaminobenzene mutase
MLVGLLSGLIVSAAPFPRLMLTAHIQFLVNGMVSVFAGLLLRTGLAIVRRPAGLLVVWAHVSVWAVCLSEVAAAWWGAKNALPLAAGLAAAPGAASWQESANPRATWDRALNGSFFGAATMPRSNAPSRPLP